MIYLIYPKHILDFPEPFSSKPRLKNLEICTFFHDLPYLYTYIPWIEWVKIFWKKNTNHIIPGIISRKNICNFFFVLYHINSSLEFGKKNDKRIWQIFPIKGGKYFSWFLITDQRAKDDIMGKIDPKMQQVFNHKKARLSEKKHFWN